LELPYWEIKRENGRKVGWREPSYEVIYNLITNPIYAGVYCYGKKRLQTDPLTHQTHVHKRPQAEWIVYLPDQHPGYITLNEFEENQKVLQNNRNQYPRSQGAAHKGAALLSGLVFCQHCGKRMRVRYTLGRPYYTCDAVERRFGGPICNRASAQRVDALVEDLFLTVVNPETLELSRSFDAKLKEEAQLVERSWLEKLKRLEYRADLARRRYEYVDPANRLVAQTLETEWNQSLVELNATQKEYLAQKVPPQELISTLNEMQTVVSQLRTYWYSADTTPQEKKELLRCLIEQVFLKTQGKIIRAQVHWYGGAISELDVPKYLFSTPHIYHRIVDLAHRLTDAEIAQQLNQEQISTAKGKPWTARRVMDFRKSNGIPSMFVCKSEALRLEEKTYLTSAEAAKHLGVSQPTVQKWFRLGLLPGKQDIGAQGLLWILWSDDLAYRLGGGAVPDARMLSVRSLCRTEKMPPDQVLAWAQEKGFKIFRLRRGNHMRFYIMPADASLPL
jgi:hypothetical protein